jgi:hypothetical protein
MPVALFIAGNFWLAAALTFGFGSRVVVVSPTTGQPQMYGFLSTDHSFSPHTYYTCLAVLVSAAVICFVLSYVAWRRQHNQPMQSTGAAGAFPVIPASDESGPRD